MLDFYSWAFFLIDILKRICGFFVIYLIIGHSESYGRTEVRPSVLRNVKYYSEVAS